MNTFEAVKQVEKELGVREGFCWNLYQNEDDWSFVVKLHALVEATISEVLSHQFKEDVWEHLRSLSLRGRTSKLGLLSNTQEPALPKKYEKYVRQLSDIRNSFVHDVGKVDISIRMYVDVLPKKQKEQFINRLRLGVASNPTAPDGRVYERDVFIEEFPKEAILLSGSLFLHAMHLALELEKRKVESQAHQKRLERVKSVLADKYVNEVRRDDE